MATAAKEVLSRMPSQVGSGGTMRPEMLGNAPEQQAYVAHGGELIIQGVKPLHFLELGIGTGAAPGYTYTVNSTGAPRAVSQHSSDSTPIWQRLLRNIKTKLQITTTDLARFLTVERPSVYQWFSNTEPRQRNMNRIQELSDLADSWSALKLGSVRSYLGRQFAGQNRSLGELLSSTDLDVRAIIQGFESFVEIEAVAPVDEKPSLAERLAARGFTPSDESQEARKRAGIIKSTSPGED